MVSSLSPPGHKVVFGSLKLSPIQIVGSQVSLLWLGQIRVSLRCLPKNNKLSILTVKKISF